MTGDEQAVGQLSTSKETVNIDDSTGALVDRTFYRGISVDDLVCPCPECTKLTGTRWMRGQVRHTVRVGPALL